MRRTLQLNTDATIISASQPYRPKLTLQKAYNRMFSHLNLLSPCRPYKSSHKLTA